MKTLILLFLFLPIFSYAANAISYSNINDGYHVVNAGTTFTASEMKINAIPCVLKELYCQAMDYDRDHAVTVHWMISVNGRSEKDYYDTNFQSWKFFPSLVYMKQLVVKAITDSGTERNPTLIKCVTMS